MRSERLADRLGVGEVYVKNDAANPTHSFKDRVVSVAVAKARELGYEVVACASTGNLANAVAAHAAAAGLESYVFVPADLEEQKILATGVYGTHLVAVDGNYDDVNRLCTELSGEHPWAFVNVNLRPYYAEGSKTLAFEVAEQLGFELPDRVVCPVASGSLFTKIAGGFEEWLELGLLEGALPAFHGAQAEGCSPVARRSRPATTSAGRCGRDTIAKSLAIGNPADGVFALDVARRTGGSIDSVTRRGDRRGDPAARRDDRHLHRDGRRRHHRGAEEARRAGRHRRGRAGGRSTSPARASRRSTPCATSSSTYDVEPTSTASARPCRSPPRGGLAQAAMAVIVKIPAQLRNLTGERGRDGGRGAARSARRWRPLYERYDGLRDRITEDGELRRFVNVYVGGEDIRFGDGLDTAVGDGDEITILPAVAGG